MTFMNDDMTDSHRALRERMNDSRTQVFGCDATFVANHHESLTDLIFDLLYSAVSVRAVLIRLYNEWMVDPGFDDDLFFLFDLADTLANTSSSLDAPPLDNHT